MTGPSARLTSIVPVLNIVVLMFVLALPAVAAEPTMDALPAAIAPCVADAPVIDGELSDAAWKAAPELGPFVTIAGAPVKENITTAKVVRSGDTIFVGVTCAISPGAELLTEHTERDSQVYMDECVEVFIDPPRAAGEILSPTITFSKYYHLIVNAANVQRDEDGDKGRTPVFDEKWNGTWRSATSRGEDSWTAEIAIPFSDLGMEAGAPAVVGLNICRADRTLGRETCWSATVTGFHQPMRFGLMGLPNAPASSSVRVTTVAPNDKGEQKITVENTSGNAMSLSALVISGAGRAQATGTLAVDLGPTGERDSAATYEIAAPTRDAITVSYATSDGASRGQSKVAIEESGRYGVMVAVNDAAGNPVALVRSVVSVPASLTAKYGYRLDAPEALGLWWAESAYKIHRDKPVPTVSSDAVRISLAGNEFEAAQIVVCPKQDIEVSVELAEFRGPGGLISRGNFQLLQVDYVPVSVPTDSFGWVDEWPDPLPTVEGPVTCKAGRNQPFWLLASVSPDAEPGVYRGGLKLLWEGEGTRGEVTAPVELEVYDFALTPETHMRTAYGVSPDFGFLGVKDRDQQREVYDLYMQCCRDHRVHPYNPMRFYPMSIKREAPMRKYTCGKLGIEIEQGQQYLWKLHWEGEELANQRVSQTHFARKGVGYEETGEGWPYVNAVESVTEISSTPDMRVLEVVGLHTGSAVAARSFKLTFRLYLPAGDNWFGWQLVKMESTDENEITVRCYFNIPRTSFKAEEVANGNGFAAWSGEGLGFGMLCLGEAVGVPRISEGGQGPTVANRVADFKIKKPETHEGWGPLVIYFLTEETSSEDLAARAEELREAINADDPAAYVPADRAEIAVESRDDYEFTHDFTQFDEGAARYLDEFKFTGYNMRCMPSSIAGHTRFTDEYKRLQKLMYGPVIEHLREKGWLQKAYSYWFDEPREEQYPYVIEGMKLLGENCPGLTRLLTEQPEAPLYADIDLWVPVLSRYKVDPCHARQDAGDLVWWYVCCGPRAPYPNNFIDHPAINHRIRFWMAEERGVTGSLYWATTYYGKKPDGSRRNPWDYAMSHSSGGGNWGNGDGMLLYPACRERSETPVLGGPVVSQRWEMLRDGLEDREYFWTLKQEVARLRALKVTAEIGKRIEIREALRQAEEALGSPGRLAEGLTVYTKDPLDLLRERDGLARAIEVCGGIR